MKTKMMFGVFFLMFSIFLGNAMAEIEGTNNNFFGTGAGDSITSGTNESFFGGNAGNATTSGSHNVFMGYNTGALNTTGHSNTFLGMNAGYYNTEGYGNTFVGRAAGFNNNTGNWNSFLGFRAGYSNTTGYHNNFIGQEAGTSNATGGYNNFFGSWSGLSNTTGRFNTFIGDYVGISNVGEDANTLVGASADIDGTNDNVHNATAIGYRAYVSQANSLVLGSIAHVNSASSNVNVGIGTSAPVRQLHIVGDQAVFRMDRPVDTAAFMLVRTDASGTPLKTFVVGANASASNTGEFVINDLGTEVSGPGTNRLRIANNGVVYVQSLVQTSSLALKDNVRTYANALETVKKLRGVSFDWKESGQPSVGLIAEEVAKVIPEVVAHEGQAATGVNYSSLVGVLVEAVKEQEGLIKQQETRHQAELNEQQALIQEQRKIISKHSEEIAELKRLLITSNVASKAD